MVALLNEAGPAIGQIDANPLSHGHNPWQISYGLHFRSPSANAPAAGQAQEFSVDTTNLLSGYVNFARMTGTPKELVLDVGLNTQMTPSLPEPIKLTHRLVLDYYTAKRLLGALS